MPTRTRQPTPTIKDVAKAAGVSVGTASNVLQGKRNLHTAATVRRVQEVATDLGYRKNAVARSLVRRRTGTLGVVLEPFHGRLTSNPYLTSIVDGFLECSVGAGYQLKIVTLVAQQYEYVMSQVEDGSVDGVLMVAPPSTSPVIGWIRESGVPAVVAGSLLPGTGIPCVDVDDEPAVLWLTKHLIAHGHRRIGLIAGPEHQFSAVRRERGYRRALDEAGIERSPALHYAGDYTTASGVAGAQALLQSAPRPTAIVCSNDGVAIGVMEHLETVGLSVPTDVSVVGFDGIEICQRTTPALTTMRQPTHEIGMMAADLLIGQIETGRRSAEAYQLPAEFVERDTVGPAADWAD